MGKSYREKMSAPPPPPKPAPTVQSNVKAVVDSKSPTGIREVKGRC